MENWIFVSTEIPFCYPEVKQPKLIKDVHSGILICGPKPSEPPKTNQGTQSQMKKIKGLSQEFQAGMA